MNRLRASLLTTALAALVTLALDAAAAGDYGNGLTLDGADLVSAHYDRLEQGDDATVFAAISDDGNHVIIQTRARNFFDDTDPDPPGFYRAGGLFRFNLETRVLDKVADGDLFRESDNAFVRRGASNPSVSADGRYVAFATAQPVLPSDTNDNADVYVRDMDVPIGQPGAFDLVSARDGGDVPATYGPPAVPFPGSNPGSDLTRGVAISGDGQRVVFRTSAPSDLPASATADVPAGQVLVRDRAANTTTLATRETAGGAPAGGGLGAAISADGSTVAWTGSNAALQARFLGGENTDPSFISYLWRRIADGPSAPTRRITGLADPDDPGCIPGTTTNFDSTSTGPCFGPLTEQEANRSSISAQVPAMSGDGYTVAFLTGAGPRPFTFTGPGLDLWITDMHAGLTRKGASVELTRDPGSAETATGSPIDSVAMSTDGRYLALATVRTTFTLPALQLSGAPRAVPNVRELYVVDLEQRSIERVTHSSSGGDVDADVQTGLTITADGARIAFTSFAGNLFFGDANQRADAFVATRQPVPDAPPPPDDNTGPPAIVVEPPKLQGSAKAHRRGVVEVTVEAPAAGDLKVVATGEVGKRQKRRNLAVAKAHADAAGPVRLTLTLVKRYRQELKRRKKIGARAELSFIPAIGGERSTGRVKLTFKA